MADHLPLGPYRLVRKLATGGMAEIFLARQEGPDGFSRDLVVKRILPHLAADRDFTRMFREEAKVAARLTHPNVVQVTDFGAVPEDDGGETLYLAMELVRGVDLRALIVRAAELGRGEGRRGAIPAHHAAKIASFVCEALAHAHGLRAEGRPVGVVHRDVTPSNVLLSFDGAVKLADFGIAKASSGTRGREATRHGVVKGKHAYLSPEQSRGEALDARSDLFNVGILLFESILGEPLFPHDDIKAARELSARGAIPGVSRFERMPPALAAVAQRALAAKREDRYPDALALRADLESYLRSAPDHSDGVELGRYVRELFPDAIEEDARGPRAAGTVKATAVLGGKTPRGSAGAAASAGRAQPAGTEVLPGGGAALTDSASRTLPREGAAGPRLGPASTPPADLSALLTAPPTELAGPPTMIGTGTTGAARAPMRKRVLAALAFAIVALATLVAVLIARSGTDEAPAIPDVPSAAPPLPTPVAAPLADAHLFIETVPPGLSLRVDGRDVGQAPLAMDLAPDLSHRVEARDESGALRVEGTLTLTVGETRELVLRAPELAQTSTLRVVTTPSGAAVQLDGRSAGQTPIALEVTPGEHRVRLSLEGFEDAEGQALVERAGEQQTLSFALRRSARPGTGVRRPPPSGGTGLLTIATTPWSEVYLGSRHLGTTPLANVELPAGSHSLTLRAEGRASSHTRVTIRAGETTRVRLVL